LHLTVPKITNFVEEYCYFKKDMLFKNVLVNLVVIYNEEMFKEQNFANKVDRARL